MRTIAIVVLASSFIIILWCLMLELKEYNVVYNNCQGNTPSVQKHAELGVEKSFIQQLISKVNEAPKTDTMSATSVQSIGHLSKAYDPYCEICDKSILGKFHIITNFFPVNHPKWATSTGKNITNPEVKKLLDERVIELLDVLQHNLNNDLIIAVHVIYNHLYIMYNLMQSSLQNKEKLVFHYVPGFITYRSSVEYIQTYLLGRAVIFLNQDVYIGEGLEKVNPDTLEKKQIAYVLTRRGKKERYCTMPDDCGPGKPYMGSHDTYILVQTNKYTEDQLKQIDHKIDNLGGENVFIHFLVNIGKFKVLNPCYVVYSYHVHCRDFHSVDRPRINRNGRSGVAGFTNLLE